MEMVLSTWGSGWKTNSRERGQKSGQMEVNIKDSTMMERKKGWECSVGWMGVVMRGSSVITLSMDMESMFGQMGGSMWGHGRITRWKGKVFLPGRMEGSTM